MDDASLPRGTLLFTKSVAKVKYESSPLSPMITSHPGITLP